MLSDTSPSAACAELTLIGPWKLGHFLDSAFGLLLLAMVLIVFSPVGCVWRTSQDEHYFGPMLFRHIQHNENTGYVSQQAHFPLLVEGGKHWAISVGAKNRFVAKAEEIKASRGLKSARTEVSHWRLSLFYTRIPITNSAEFWRTKNYGVTIGLGSEVNTLSIGIATHSAMRAEPDKLYSLDYDDRQPMLTKFIVLQTFDNQEVSAFLREVEQ